VARETILRVIDGANWALQLGCILANCAMALSSVHQHHYGGAAFSAGCAAFLILINGLIARERKRHNALRAQYEQMLRGQILAQDGVASMSFSTEVLVTAQKHLDMVCKALGAELEKVGDGRDPVYKVCVAGVEYWVCRNGIFKDSLVSATAPSTCLRNTYCLPPAEQIASILLALHHDPGLFEKWRIYQYQGWI